jgi:uncharacterized membrane protein YphA (DoxX/SURF4 family)
MAIYESRGAKIARYVLGTIFTVFGLNGFFGFLPMPPLEADAGAFMGALAATGYMFPLIKGSEVVAGLLLLSGRAVGFAGMLLAPIVANIVLFHAVLAPSGIALPLIIVGLMAYLGYQHRSLFQRLFAGVERRHAVTREGHAHAHG